MSSLRLRLIGGAIRPVAQYVLSRAQDPLAERARFEFLAGSGFIGPRGVTTVEEPGFAGGGHAALWVGARGARKTGAILHFHGGGYIVGTPRAYWKIAGHLSRAAGVRVFLPHYRLAPEHSLLETIEDARGAWDFLRASGFAPADIALGGDSAGGGLALSLLASLLAEGARPACLYLWSPFADQTFSGASVRENAQRDHFFPAERVHDLPEMILHDLAPDDPRVSPLFAAFPAPPPALIQASDCELLRDDATRLAAKFRAEGGEVTLELQEDAPHVWHLLHGWVPEARAAVARTGAFVRRHLGG